mmetsp:Transcript_107228/g.160364  ORF Transcript_107228/g.160364 Transcript_107228/m.160364 type:complete len:218 (-) Transcript_107228:3-656(-)
MPVLVVRPARETGILRLLPFSSLLGKVETFFVLDLPEKVGGSAFSANENVAPPATFSTHMAPFIRSTKRLQRFNPRPVPNGSSLELSSATRGQVDQFDAKRRKSCPAFSFGMPLPWSETETIANCGSFVRSSCDMLVLSLAECHTAGSMLDASAPAIHLRTSLILRRRVRTEIDPWVGEYLIAFDSKFIMTCWSRNLFVWTKTPSSLPSSWSVFSDR